MAEAAGLRLVWRPILLGPIFQAQLGYADSPFNRNPVRAEDHDIASPEVIRELARPELIQQAIAWRTRSRGRPRRRRLSPARRGRPVAAPGELQPRTVVPQQLG